MSLIDPVDTYFAWVKQQMVASEATLTLNGQTQLQPIGGIVQARDWPGTPVKEGYLYLLVLDGVPGQGTRSQRGYIQFLQWSWLLLGQDIQANAQAQNRGDRYRNNMQVQENLRQAHYPGFCQKQGLTADQEGTLTFVPSSTTNPPNSYEHVWWTELHFRSRNDNQQSGLLYGIADFELYAFSNVSPLIA